MNLGRPTGIVRMLTIQSPHSSTFSLQVTRSSCAPSHQHPHICINLSFLSAFGCDTYGTTGTTPQTSCGHGFEGAWFRGNSVLTTKPHDFLVGGSQGWLVTGRGSHAPTRTLSCLQGE